MVDTWAHAHYRTYMSKRLIVLDVGQCDMDHSAIRRVVESLGATVRRAHSRKEALKCIEAESFALILVNRIFDMTGEEGLDLIEEMCRGGRVDCPVMIVSNYPDAQAEAIKRGAVQGFGKTALRDSRTLDLIRVHLVGSTE